MISTRRLRGAARERVWMALDRACESRVRESILLQGFFRSGTTWLQQQVAEALCGKAVFEPLSPPTGHRWPRQNLEDATSIQSYLPLAWEDVDATTLIALQGAARGNAANRFSLRARTRTREAFRKVAVVKHVRLGAVLDELLEQLPQPALVIRRHPAAVYRSMRNVQWTWSYDDVDYRRTYLDASGRAAPLHTYNGDALERIAVAWAMSERGAQAAVDAGRATLIRFEEAAVRPAVVHTALEGLGFHVQSRQAVRSDSPTTSAADLGSSAGVRVSAWRRSIDADSLQRLERITTAVFPGCASMWSEID